MRNGLPYWEMQPCVDRHRKNIILVLMLAHRAAALEVVDEEECLAEPGLYKAIEELESFIAAQLSELNRILDTSMMQTLDGLLT